MNKIVTIVAEALGTTTTMITSKGQKTDQLYVRYITIAILREEGYSIDQITEIFTLFARNTIANHCVEVFDDLLRYNKKFKEMYLKAVKAVEEMKNESENDTSAA